VTRDATMPGREGNMRVALLVLAVCAGVYVWVSSAAMPGMVASHFGP